MPRYIVMDKTPTGTSGTTGTPVKSCKNQCLPHSVSLSGLPTDTKKNYLGGSRLPILLLKKKGGEWQGCKSSNTDLDIRVNQATTLLLSAGTEQKRPVIYYLAVPQWAAGDRSRQEVSDGHRWVTAETLSSCCGCSCCYLQATAHWADSVA